MERKKIPKKQSKLMHISPLCSQKRAENARFKAFRSNGRHFVKNKAFSSKFGARSSKFSCLSSHDTLTRQKTDDERATAAQTTTMATTPHPPAAAAAPAATPFSVADAMKSFSLPSVADAGRPLQRPWLPLQKISAKTLQ